MLYNFDVLLKLSVEFFHKLIQQKFKSKTMKFDEKEKFKMKILLDKHYNIKEKSNYFLTFVPPKNSDIINVNTISRFN